MSGISYWVWYSHRRLRPESRMRLLEHFEDPERIFFAEEKVFSDFGLQKEERKSLEDRSLDEARKILRRCEELDVQIVTMQDAAYPIRLRNIYDPPVLLYVLGRLPAVDEYAAIAIVGTRKATAYGLKMGLRMGYELTKGGGLVISGLAEGVDSSGARGALRAGGSCIGVLGTGIDQIYPSFNRRLFEDVRHSGALVSEYPPGVSGSRSSFPRRNRIISGLSAGVVVIEAPEKSGALITAARALEQGRDLFVVPGNADSANCVGSNALLKDCAKAVTSGEDVLVDYEHLYSGLLPDQAKNAPENIYEVLKDASSPEEKAPKNEKSGGFSIFRHTVRKQEEKPKPKLVLPEDATPQQLRLIGVMSEEKMRMDEIIEKSGLSAAAALSAMTMLEIEGLVARSDGNRYALQFPEK